jgi:hypothetical protein
MFPVEWLQVALDESAAAWNAADSAGRTAMTSAAHRIDRRLALDAPNEGESRARNRRFLYKPPLAVTFHIDPDKNLVTVLHVRYVRRRPRP